MQKLIVGLAVIAVVIFIAALGYSLTQPPPSPPEPAPPVASNGPTDKPDKPVPPPPDQTPDPAAKPVKPTGDTTPPKPEPVEPVIEPIAIDGADVADSLKLEMYKFAFTVPADQYTVHVWVERWTRGEQEPTRTVLIEQNGQFEQGTILVQVPSAAWPLGVVKVGSWEVRLDEPLKIGTPMSIRSLKTTEPITAGGDLHLVAYTFNESGRPVAGLKDVHTQNDVTIYLKARFTPGPFKPFNPPAPPAVEPAKEPVKEPAKEPEPAPAKAP